MKEITFFETSDWSRHLQYWKQDIEWARVRLFWDWEFEKIKNMELEKVKKLIDNVLDFNHLKIDE